MKISLSWLNDYVRTDLPAAELAEKLTMIGLVVESVEEARGDAIFEVETYANRPDTLGHLGIAREAAAMLGHPLAEPDCPLVELPQAASDLVSIQIADENLCPRYCGLLVRDVKVGPSPDWLRQRIEAMGLRPINNIVDISNYVLFATAQPIHAFDFAKLAGARIIVRRAKKGELLKALDGRVLELTPEMLVIADADKPVGLAGIIGGLETGVTEETRDVLIESANFNPVSVRLTGKRLGVSTDASYRFERGADIGFAPRAALLAASLMTRFGGKATRGLIDVYPKPRKPKSVVLRHRRTTELLGVEVPSEFIPRVLSDLGFSVEESQKGVWRVGVPSFRVDIDREADLIEEVARFYGYDRIPSQVTPALSFEPVQNKRRERILRLRQVLFHYGCDEVINFSFSDPEREALLRNGRSPIAIRNPISAMASVLRTSLLPGLLENAEWNRNRGWEDVRIFEVGNAYFWEEEKPKEVLTLGVLTTQPRGGSGEKSGEAGFFELKGALESLLTCLRYEPFGFAAAEDPCFAEGACLSVQFKGEEVGRLGRLRPDLCASFAVEGPVFAAEINLSGLFEKQPRPFQYVPVVKFPAISRDLSFLVGRAVAWQDIQKTVEKLNLSFLEEFEVYDRFSGPSVPADKVSLSLRFRFRHPQRTLLAEEVERIEKDIIGHLKSAFHIQLRKGGGKIDK